MKQFLFFITFIFLSNHVYAIDFSRACESKSSEIVISGVGDILMHSGLQKTAYKYGIDSMWGNLKPLFSATDLNYANLETPVAAGVSGGREVKDPGPIYDNKVYSGYPLFNTHPSVVDDISRTFDVVSTANNHALDRGSLGVNKTIDSLKDAGLQYTGTIKSGGERSWHTIVRRSGWNIAFVACSFSTNGNPDKYNQVLGCFKNKSELMGIVSSLAKQRGVDAVIVTPHWGEVEYKDSPDSANVKLGRELIDAGAKAVIGTHPHVIQTWERYASPNGQEGLIAFSTGNFISQQFFKNRPKTRLGLMVFLGLSKKGNDVWVNGVRYTPIWMESKPLGAVPLEKSSASSSIENHVNKLLGTDDRLYIGQRLVTNPRCY
jgi:poly-gamma-glutamate capsule biosynthesis protein CapA/YwtB (metallophosphatase superfamily)